MARAGRSQRRPPIVWVGAGWDETQTFTAAVIQEAAAMSATVTETFTLVGGMTQAAAALEVILPTNFTLEVDMAQSAQSFGANVAVDSNEPRRTGFNRKGVDADNKEDPAFLGYASRKGPHRAP